MRLGWWPAARRRRRRRQIKRSPEAPPRPRGDSNDVRSTFRSVSKAQRVSYMVASGQDIGASAVVCLGYPLKGINGAVRDEILLKLRVPIMFVQGSKDGLCPLDKLEAVRKKMTCANELHVIEGGDHSFKIVLLTIAYAVLGIASTTHEKAKLYTNTSEALDNSVEEARRLPSIKLSDNGQGLSENDGETGKARFRLLTDLLSGQVNMEKEMV
nr:KAT8 regulatory NSL complex subunit 3 [Ipomoea trifida]